MEKYWRRKRNRSRRCAAVLALVLTASLSVGCGQITLPDPGTTDSSTSTGTTETTEDGQGLIHRIAEFFGLNDAAEQIGDGAFDDTDATSVTETQDTGTQDTGTQDTGTQDTEGGVTGSSDETDTSLYFSLLPESLDERYQDNLPEGDSLFINNAPLFYYYSVLSEEQQQIYDAFLAVLQQPDSTEYRKGVHVTEEPYSDTFKTNIKCAYNALIFDHPEFFWFSQNSSFHYYYSSGKQSDGTYTVMIQLGETYDNYETEMTAFNQAVDQFMAQIDLTQSQPMIALQIHDLLIDTVTYDDALADATETAGNVTDYGYTAYGALVANSRGEANTAVCDGYTYAFEYLCQQAGLTVTRVTGEAGSSLDDMGGHSWNLIQYDDGQWYEVDATWDDREPQISADDPAAYIYEAAMADETYWGRIRHFLFNVTTEEISYFQPDWTYTYYMEDGSYATFLGESWHVRDDGSDPSTGDYISYLAPIAYGTQYSYDNLMGYNFDQ